MAEELDDKVKTIVALFAMTEYARTESAQRQLSPLPHSAEQQARLKKLFESASYTEEGFRVLELQSCCDSGDVVSRLKEVGRLARSRPGASVVVVWSGHGRTFDRELRLATPECAEPFENEDGVSAREIVVSTGAKAASHYCVFIDACEASGGASEISAVAADRDWDDNAGARSFAAFFASHPYASAKDGVFLELLVRLLESGPSENAEKQAREAWGNFGFSEQNRLLSAHDIEQCINAEILADPEKARGVRVPEPATRGSQCLFPNPRFRRDAPPRMVDRHALGKHFLPKARGIEVNEEGWHFSGRIEASRAILEWLGDNSGDVPPVYVVTGEGGTGKSALLGRLIALADPETREQLRGEGWNEATEAGQGTVPDPGAFDAALHLRNLTAQRAAEQLAEILGLARSESPEAFVEAFAGQDVAGMRIVFDALDEAEDPQAIVLRLVRPLARAGWRFLVATRRSSQARGAGDLVALLRGDSGEPYDLGADRDSGKDLAAYVASRIRAAGAPQFTDDEALVELAGARVAERAQGKFLYARIATSNLLRTIEEITAESIDDLLGADVGGVFGQDLLTLDRAFQQEFARKDRGATRLLEALAWGQGKGLPIRDGVWATVAGALAGAWRPGVEVEYGEQHVHWLLREAGRYVLEDGDGEQAVYRLFHQALVDHFRAQPVADAARAVATALAGLVDEAGGWRCANPYLARHMAAHWAVCRPQDELYLLLTTFDWMQARLEASDAYELVKDYDYVEQPAPPVVTRIGRTLSMVSHILLKDKRQLVPQLLGRVAPLDDLTRRLCERARQAIHQPTWVPRLGGLEQEGDLARTIHLGAAHRPAGLSPSGAFLISLGVNRTMCLWDLNLGSVIWEAEHKGLNEDRVIVLNSEGTMFASADWDGHVHLWDCEDGRLIGTLNCGEGNANCIAFNSDGSHIAIGTDNAVLGVWQVSDQQKVNEFSCWIEDEIVSVSFSPDGECAVVGSLMGGVRLWKVTSGELLKDLQPHGGHLARVAYSHDGACVVAVVSGIVMLWKTVSGRLLKDPVDSGPSLVRCLAISPDGMRMAIGGEFGSLRLWETKPVKAIGNPLHGHSETVRWAAFSRDGTQLTSISVDGVVRVWDVARVGTGDESLYEHEGGVSCVASSPDGTRIVSGGRDGFIRLWNADTGEQLNHAYCGGGNLVDKKIACVAFHVDGTLLSSGGDGVVRLWDARTFQAIGDPMPGHKWIECVAFNFEATRILVADGSGSLSFWDIETCQRIGEPLCLYDGYFEGAAFSKDAAYVVTTCQTERYSLRLAATDSAQLLGKLYGGLSYERSVSFSSDASMVVSGGNDGTVTIWDITRDFHSREKRFGHDDRVCCVAFSADSKYVVSGGADSAVCLWQAEGRESAVAVIHGDASISCVAQIPSDSRMSVVVGQATGRLLFLDLVVPHDHSPPSTTT